MKKTYTTYAEEAQNLGGQNYDNYHTTYETLHRSCNGNKVLFRRVDSWQLFLLVAEEQDVIKL